MGLSASAGQVAERSGRSDLDREKVDGDMVNEVFTMHNGGKIKYIYKKSINPLPKWLTPNCISNPSAVVE